MRQTPPSKKLQSTALLFCKVYSRIVNGFTEESAKDGSLLVTKKSGITQGCARVKLAEDLLILDIHKLNVVYLYQNKGWIMSVSCVSD